MANLFECGVGAPNLQSKTVSPSASAQTIKPDSNYDGLSQVTVNAATLQSKSVSPSASAQTIKPDSGKYGLSQVVVSAAPLQAKTVSPSTSAQTIKPDSGKYGLSQVVVNGINTVIPDVTYEYSLYTTGHSGNGAGWANGNTTLKIPTGPFNYIVAVTGDISGVSPGWISSNSEIIVSMTVPMNEGFTNTRSGTITLGIR